YKFTVRGTVVGPNDVPLPGATVYLGSLQTTTNSSGTFTISGVPNGSYAMAVKKPDYRFSPQPYTLTVNNGDRGGLLFRGRFTQCADKVDNDGDGAIDGADFSCSS